MIIVYDQREEDFSPNSYGPVIAASAVVTEKLNGWLELSMTCHALENNQGWRYLQEFGLVKVPTPWGMQMFRVYQVKKEMLERKVTVNARHIFYDAAIFCL